MAETGRVGNESYDERSLGELVRQLSEQSGRLASMEIELAKAELARKGRQLGIGASSLGVAGVLGLFAFGALTAALILALAEAVNAWLAALIVAAVYASATGVLALLGKQRVEEATPPTPDRAISSSKDDVEAAKRSAKEARA
jgi:hypothetical protein